ncbi:hypothetical protein [Rheinheimera aquimaris]|jgi:hypothetical protein|uniref:hypothetical protein n=2 Tax=Rheinheimera aquimaris TaxID=412437 RepID=UPI000E7D7E4C|nr:hypothetical protein [Rheinheimera aquimaris]MCD1600015.1 hypothetical protein [Rheinheimera aquimaris]HBN90166.1 hypothetical protein [Rheinheimera sp.]
MYSYMKPTLMLAMPIVVYLTVYAVGIAMDNDLFHYLAVYMAACCAMLMLFVVARESDDYKSALAAVAFGASVFFASSYVIQLLSQPDYQRPNYAPPVSVSPAASVVQRWLVQQAQNQPELISAEVVEPVVAQTLENTNG